MENSFYVYALRVDGERDPFYIGKGKGTRAYTHFYERNVNRKSHKNHVIKQAWNNDKEVLIEFLHKNLTEARALKLEADYIFHYGQRSDGNGCLTNLADGGTGSTGYRHSEDAKARIQKAAKGRSHTAEAKAKIAEAARQQKRKPITEETRAKLRAARAKRVMPPMSDEQKEKLRVAHLGRKASEETCQKISEALKGRSVSDETREKLRKSNIGKTHGPMSEEHRDKISVALSGKPKTHRHTSKASAARIGQKRTPEQRENMRQAALKRAPMTDEHRQKLSDAQKSRWARERGQ
jgi:hypothetical protein